MDSFLDYSEQVLKSRQTLEAVETGVVRTNKRLKVALVQPWSKACPHAEVGAGRGMSDYTEYRIYLYLLISLSNGEKPLALLNWQII